MQMYADFTLVQHTFAHQLRIYDLNVISPLQRTMRMSSGKKRPAIHLEAAFDQTASSQNEFHQPGVSHDRTFTSDSRSMGSADGAASNEIDFHKLSDEEVRERFRAMMVRSFSPMRARSLHGHVLGWYNWRKRSENENVWTNTNTTHARNAHLTLQTSDGQSKKS